ncbi:MAG: response regulator [Planctomycetota bacterium]
MNTPLRKILIVDDDEMNLEMLDAVLGDRFELQRARSGEQAIAALRDFAAEVVLLDIVMPGIDGYETCRRITSDPATDSAKVILLSGKSTKAERMRGYEVGASDYLVKPFDPDELAAKVDVFLALKSAQDASRAKSAFVANISHEIRTPMTAILGNSENLRDGSLSPAERTEALDTIWRNGQHLLELLNNILDLSKIEANGMVVERLECSPFEMVTEVLEMLRSRAQARGLALDARVEGGVPVTIRTDRTRLKQVLINIIGNALKFTERGGVHVRMRMAPQPTAEPLLEVEVEDTGIGIEAEKIQTLCQPFVQADSSVTRRFGGSGLGLSISKRLAGLLGGDLAIRSVPGKGSIFSVTVATGPLDGVRMAEAFPVATPAPALAATGGVEVPLRSRRILLAEDGLDNQRLLTYVLRKAGAEMEVVANGRLAVDSALAAIRDGHPYDVILMDMQMPVLDGYAATAQLRESGYKGPIIGVTAHAMADERQRCLSVGCDRFAAKPVDRQALIQTILELVDRE